MKKTALGVLLLQFFISEVSFAKTPFLCTHPQVCNLARELVLKNQKIEFKLLNGMQNINPHHASPSISIIKKLKRAERVIYAPLELHPWFKNFENGQTESFRILVNENMKKVGAPHQVAHFWLHPILLCEVEKQLRNHFEKIQIQTTDPKQGRCENENETPDLKGKTIVLTHDGLYPYLKNAGGNVILIQSHAEHHELTPKMLKILIKEIQSGKKIFWILESQFHHPEAVENLIKPEHKVLRLNTQGQDFDPVNSILLKIRDFFNKS